MDTSQKMACCKSHENCCLSSGNASVSQTLEEMDFERGIWYAAQTGDLPRVEYLLNVKSISPNIQDKSGYVALHYAARNGHLNVCKLLIRAGADVNLTTRAGKSTPLHRAAGCGHTEIVGLLLGKERGFPQRADVVMQDADGNTALHKAAQGGHDYTVTLLLEECPHLTMIPNNKGLLPKDYVTAGNVIKLLEN